MYVCSSCFSRSSILVSAIFLFSNSASFSFIYFFISFISIKNKRCGRKKSGSAFPVALHSESSGRINVPHGGTKPYDV